LGNPRKLPLLSGQEVIKALRKVGFEVIRRRGSHVFLKHGDGRNVTVPLHAEVDRGTLLAIIKQANMTKEEFLNIL